MADQRRGIRARNNRKLVNIIKMKSIVITFSVIIVLLLRFFNI
jgi:hypothetical protein